MENKEVMKRSFLADGRWRRSLAEFKKLDVVVFCGMMCAVAIVLGSLASINIGQYVRIGFSNLPNLVVDYLFGPAIGAVFGGALDIIKYLIKPTGAFFPGFTLSAMLGGIIYGWFFYKKNITIPRILLGHLTVKVLVNLVLNTLWLDMLYGNGFWAILPGRIVSNAVMLPIDTVITYVLFLAVKRTILPYFNQGK